MRHLQNSDKKKELKRSPAYHKRLNGFRETIDQFVKERRYLQNVTAKTVSWYQQSFKVFQDNHSEELSKASLAELVFKPREKGMAATSVQYVYAGQQLFLPGLHENQHTKDHCVSNSQNKRKRIHTFSDAHLKALLTWKPKG